MNDMTSMKGAEKLCRNRIDSTPRHTTYILRSQNPRKLAHSTDGIWAVVGHRTASIAAIACPPNQDWIPNHPQATKARSIAGRFAPRVPKLARTNTGNGIPYFAPAWAFRSIGTSTIRFPRRIVKIACFQFMPPAISEEASMYVVTSIDMENQRAM